MATREVSDKDFNAAIKMVAKQFGEGYLSFGLSDFSPASIPTGHDDLDVWLTRGTPAPGIYQGGIIEVMGSEFSGKTSFALRVLGNAQRLGHRCSWFDAECAFNEDIAKINGCDPTKLHLPDLSETKVIEQRKDDNESISFFNAEEVLEMVYKTIVTNLFGVIVLDSVAGLMPERVLTDDDPNKKGVAELARAMSDKLRKIAPACKKTKTSVIFINQLRDQPGAYMQNRFHSPGGRALKFFAHQRLSLEKRGGAEGKVYEESDDGTKTVIGHYSKFTIIKNRLSAPPPEDLVIECPIYYKVYFPDTAKKLYDLARKLQVITIRNSTLTWKQGDAIVMQEVGEAAILARIRNEHLESQLAAACVAAEGEDKNKSKNKPVLVPTTLRSLADTFSTNATVETEVKKETKKPKRGTVGKLDLDE